MATTIESIGTDSRHIRTQGNGLLGHTLICACAPESIVTDSGHTTAHLNRCQFGSILEQIRVDGGHLVANDDARGTREVAAIALCRQVAA